MVAKSRIRHLEEQIQAKMESRAKLMDAFVEAPGLMQSKSDHTRQDIATEISVIDKSIQALREIIFQLETLAPDDSGAVQIGHTVCLQIGDEEPERFLLLDGLGGVTLDDVSTLSVDTPIGHAVVGKEVGDQVSASVPGGQLSIRILSLE
jgi:transcription elongation factor GreA